MGSNPIFSTIFYFTYILESQLDGRFYIGQTQNLEKRVKHHNKGYSKYTKKFRPWRLIWYIAFDSRKEAYQTEQRIKKLKSRKRLLDYIDHNGVKVMGSEK